MLDDAVQLDLWTKFAALDQCCRVFITRHGEPGNPRVWRIQVIRGDQILTFDDISLLRAMTAAVLGAESRGWHSARAS